jgi:hypothetical protein
MCSIIVGEIIGEWVFVNVDKRNIVRNSEMKFLRKTLLGRGGRGSGGGGWGQFYKKIPTLHKYPLQTTLGPGGSVGIATGTGWTVRESNPSGGEIFRTCPDWPWSPPNLLYNGYRVFPGGRKRPGRDANPSPPSSAET